MMTKYHATTLLFLIAAMGCGSTPSEWDFGEGVAATSESADHDPSAPATSGENRFRYFATFSKSDGEGDAPNSQPSAKVRRQVIYTGVFELLVPLVEDSLKQFLVAVEAVGGHLQSRGDDRVVCRIPADRFQEVVADLPKFGTLLSQSINARDVTMEYHDLALRIETARRALARLMALVEKAETVEEVLEIEKEIHRLTEQIERFSGQMRVLSDQITYSTLTVTFRANAPPPRQVRLRKDSRFPWIRKVGIEKVLGTF